ncbi:MAG TPA: TetR/AcrR family transcriptional regulator [Actinomycetota bacterium]|jgi:AcrR family transcriptional regulator|nr:TetR/AcrR family transcriptional regulator [Actinomycetota bacterium]
MPQTADDWPPLPDVQEPQPPRERRSWGKVSHTDRYRRQRRDLLRAAGRLAAQKGFEGPRVADIVAEAGLSKSTFYEHFASKEDCFVELHRRTSAQMLQTAVDAAEAHAQRGAYECLDAVIRAFVGYADRNPRLAQVLGPAFGASLPVVQKQREENFRRVVHFFATLGRRLGSKLEPDELELTSTILVGGVTDILGDLRRDQDTLDGKLSQIASLGCRAFGLDRS